MKKFILKPTTTTFFFLLFLSSMACSFGQVSYTADTTAGCAPLIVSFQGTAPNATSWDWDFGVSTSTLAQPGVVFSAPGVYDVTLVVTYSNGTKDTLHKPQYIQVHPNPVADFGVSSQWVCARNSVNFSDQTFLSTGTVSQWIWDYGDGTTNSQQNPNHVYTFPGLYPVSLFVVSQQGCTDNITKNNFITVTAPDVNFSGDSLLACGPPLDVQFTSANAAGTHSWIFGDGGTSSQANPQHTYTQVGSFDVKHIITDNNGCSDTLVYNNYVNIGVNTLSVSASDTIACMGDTTWFYTNATVRGTITWDFGDGDSSHLLNPFHNYLTAGNYTVRSSITDVSGCISTTSLSVNVYDRPVVDWTVADTTLGCDVPFPVDFINLTTGATSYGWRFSGLPNSTLQNPSVVFTTPGFKTVSLVAEGPGGCKMGIDYKKYIQIIENEVGFKASERGGCNPLTVTFTDTSKSVFPIVGWKWSFGNGDSAFVANPTYTFTDTGYFDICLAITNSEGCTDTLCRPGYISVGEKPIANFVADTTMACVSTAVNFTNLSTGGDSFVWYFGDNDTAMSVNASHNFGALGKMYVALVASDRGCTDTLIKNDYIDILAPLPIIGASEKKICRVPANVNFSNLSIGAHRYLWDFGNGDTSYLASPTSTYTAEGSYPVSLTTWNDTTGCMASATDSIRILTIVSDFIPDTTRGCNPVTISFKDTSHNAIKWWWEFGNGDTTTQQNPSIRFKQAGVYSVQLVTMNNLRCKDTLFIDSMIHSLEVNADFTIANPSAGCVPLILDFVDQSQGTGPITNWNWDFGDGTGSALQNPSHIYPIPNYYTVKLAVTDVDGCQDSLSRTDIVYATQPVPDFTANHPVNCTDNPITFVSLATGAGLAYYWDFGDGTHSILANPKHTYIQNGIYTVSLSVSDVNGCDSTMTKNNYIIIDQLDATFVADTTSANCPPLSVTFTSATQVSLGNISWLWDFGDGATSSQVSPVHNYTTAGIYDVTLILTNPAGCTDTMIRRNYIDIQGPDGSFVFAPPAGCPGTPVNFMSTTSNAVTYQWLFGDGSTGQGVNTTHTYSGSGFYHPALALTDSEGCRVFILATDSVEVFEAPIADFSSNTRTVCNSGAVSFTNASISNLPITQYAWDFGDGNTSPQQHPVHTYMTPGIYTVTLTVTNSKGCEHTRTQPNLIWVNPNPTAVFSVTDTTGCAPFSASFKDNSISSGVPITQWNWDFGNSQTATNQYPSHTFSQPGYYTVVLTITDSLGCTSSTQHSIQSWAPPTTNFIGIDSMGCAPTMVDFIDLSTGAVQWDWDFGDGNQSTAANPTHPYLADGKYTVSLKVWNTHGCTDSLTKNEYIQLNHPEANFAISDSVSCPGVDILFTDLSQSDTTLVDWYWEFGDGTTGTGSSSSHSYTDAGVYTLRLTVTDIFGCSHTLSKNLSLLIVPDITPVAPNLQFVSVIGDHEIAVSFDSFENTLGDFNQYVIYRATRNGAFVPVHSVYQIADNYWVDKNVNTRNQSYCYKVTVVNQCGTESALSVSKPHCSIELATTANVDHVNLSWTPYIGWTVVGYNIYRVDGYTPQRHELIATLSGMDSMYHHGDMYCPEQFDYRVEALSSFHGHTSYSDTSVAFHEHIGPEENMHMSLATVEDNKFVKVEWEVPKLVKLESVILEKDNGSGFKEILREPATAGNFKYQDKETEVSSQSYRYRAFAMDSCGDYTALGREASSIFLQASQKLGTIYVTWTPYQEWEEGVDRYIVEVLDEGTGIYEIVETLPGNVTSFVDNRTELDQPTQCYRVKAFERDGRRQSSLSNEACVVLDPRVYTPNTFSPNQDGINDYFTINGIFVADFRLKIYNRWGNPVFESSDMSQPWDGTFQGKPVPEGVYVYVASGIGHSGQQLDRTGSVTLIR